MPSTYTIFLVLGVVLAVVAVKPPPYDQDPKPNTYVLNNRDLKLSWTVDWTNEEVTFSVENPFKADRRYFMFGFSYYEDTNRSDYCLLDRDDPKKITDGSVGSNGEMLVDDQQDWHLLSRNATSITFKRKFDTCDPLDTVINEQTMHIVWVRSNQPIVKMSPNKNKSDIMLRSRPPVSPRMGNMTMPIVREHDGITPAQILMINLVVPEKESDIIDIPITANNHHVGPGNFYLCKIFNLDRLSKFKHHLIQWYPILSYPHLHHHIALYHCDLDPSVKMDMYDGECAKRGNYLSQCQRALAIRGIGAPGFTFPSEAGLPMGGPEMNSYYRLEVHYVNSNNTVGMIDNSGIMLRVLDKPRKHDAGHMELGLNFEDTFAMPTGQVAFPIGSKCTSGCTSTAFPKEGITIVGGGFHEHSHGRRLTLHHLRNSQVLGTVFKEEYFSEFAQHYFIMREPVKVLPGDELLTQCYYQTLGIDHTVTTGLGSDTEMCLQYLVYYPAVNMVRCKTTINNKHLTKYFGTMKSQFPAIDLKDTNAKNYARIGWTPENVDKLHNLYTNVPLDAICTMNNDTQWPGNHSDVAPQKIWPISNLTHWVDGNCNPKGVVPLERRRCGYMGDCYY